MPLFDPLHTAILIAGLMGFLLGAFAYLTLAERKVSAWVQGRVGPNRVGPAGLLQPIADGGKFFLKEEIIPAHVDRVFYSLAPIVGLGTAFLAMAVVPFGFVAPPPDPVAVVATADTSPVERFDTAQAEYRSHFAFAVAPGLDVGVLYVFALGSLAVYGVILAGWSANNKYSLLGALRSSAQIVSYEIPLGMALVGVFLTVGSLNLEKVVDWQAHHGWFVAFQPLALLLYMVSSYAECNRLPFDLPEAEQELVGGYHTEYSSSMKLAMLLMGEYFNLVTASFITALVFLGGWNLFGLESAFADPVAAAVVKLVILVGKMFALVLFALLIRWTIPRFRFDQLMDLAWKVMIPLATLNLFFTMLVLQFGWPPVVMLGVSAVLFVVTGWLIARRPAASDQRRPFVRQPVGLPAGVTFAGR